MVVIVLPVAFDRQDLAGKDSLSVHDDGTASACALVTGNLGACKTEGLPERLGQRMGRGDFAGLAPYVELVILSIHREADAAGPGCIANSPVCLACGHFSSPNP